MVYRQIRVLRNLKEAEEELLPLKDLVQKNNEK